MDKAVAIAVGVGIVLVVGFIFMPKAQEYSNNTMDQIEQTTNGFYSQFNSSIPPVE